MPSENDQGRPQFLKLKGNFENMQIHRNVCIGSDIDLSEASGTFSLRDNVFVQGRLKTGRISGNLSNLNFESCIGTAAELRVGRYLLKIGSDASKVEADVHVSHNDAV